MLDIIPDPLWGKPCLAIHIQPVLSPNVQEALAGLQREAASVWPTPLHCGPPHALHVTVYPLVPVKDGFDKDAYWQAIAGRSRAIVEQLTADHPPITLRFHRFMVTNVAIIAVAEEASGLVERIRERVLQEVPPPPGREHVHYDLVHTTLARFPVATRVPKAFVERLEAMPVSVDAPVDRLRLIRETLFPCIETQELASFRLAAAGQNPPPP